MYTGLSVLMIERPILNIDLANRDFTKITL